jgi:hypothetical protein
MQRLAAVVLALVTFTGASRAGAGETATDRFAGPAFGLDLGKKF